MNIESILISLPKKAVSFLQLRRYFADQVLFHENIIIPEKTPEGFDANIREKCHEVYFKAKDYYKNVGYNLNRAISNSILEPIKNANFYGGREDYHMITFRGIFSRVAMLTSYNDGGNYFKDPKIKHEFENRINSGEHFDKLIENKDGKKFVGYGMGKEIIFSINDFIFVDTKNGTLYTGISRNNNCFTKI